MWNCKCWWIWTSERDVRTDGGLSSVPSNLVLRLEELIFSSSMSARWASFNSWISYRTSSSSQSLHRKHHWITFYKQINDQIMVKPRQQQSPTHWGHYGHKHTEFMWIIKFKVHRSLVYDLLRITHLMGDNKSTLNCQNQRLSDTSFIINKLKLYNYYIINYRSKVWGWYIWGWLLHLFDQKYCKTVNHFYNLKEQFSTLIYLKM